MKLENVKTIIFLGARYEVEYAPIANNKIYTATYDGHCNSSNSSFAISQEIPKPRQSLVIWHEIFHVIDNAFHILGSGEKLSEAELDRLAAGMQALEIEYQEGKNAAS